MNRNNRLLTDSKPRITNNKDTFQSNNFEALRKALTINPAEIIEMIISSGLRGRGGAGFPTGMKIKFTAQNLADEKYIICNADEGEPGTFKDKLLLEKHPYLVIEGMIVAAYAIGATCGYFYIRGEYVDAIKSIHTAIEEARKNNIIGESILGSNFSFDLKIRVGAGSYLCGEELTLIESLEGKRGHPRIKPPFPAEKGLFGKPTLVNNVETLANIPFIITNGADKFREQGTEKSPGTKLFCLSGDILKPGCYEAPLGTSLRELIFSYGGGMHENTLFKAAVLGGAAGTFADASMLDLPMAYETLAENNLTLGSGAIIILNNRRSVPDMLVSILEFFKHESCGKCVPCRVGTCSLTSMAAMLKKKKTEKEKLVNDMISQAKMMAATSLCPLGQSPVLPLRSAFHFFKDEFISMKEKKKE